MRGNDSGSVWIQGSGSVLIRGSGSVWIWVHTGGSHVRSLWGLILTLAYITKRLSEEEEEKKRHLVGGQIALLIHSECEGLHASDPLPFPAPSRRVRLLHQPSPAFGNRLPSPAAYNRLLPPSPPRAPTTGFHRIHHLACPWALTTGFHRLPPPCMPLGCDNHGQMNLHLIWVYGLVRQFIWGLL